MIRCRNLSNKYKGSNCIFRTHEYLLILSAIADCNLIAGPKQTIKNDQLTGSFEYLIFKINKIVLMHTAIEFAMIMTKSFIPIPYTTHKLRPIINTITNHIETSSVFLVFIDLII